MVLRKILFVTIILAFVFSGCKKKEGCTNVNALNYDSSVTKDNGSCTFPKSVVVNYVKLTSHPNVNPQGQPWTAGGQNPDYLIQIKDHGAIVYQSEVKQEAVLPVTFNVSTLVKFGDSNRVMIHLFLGDNGNQPLERNILEIILSDYIQGQGSGTYPEIISRTHLGYTYEIGVTWE